MAQGALELQARRVCVLDGTTRAEELQAWTDTVRLEAREAQRSADGRVQAQGLTLWPCRCVSVGLFARSVRWDGGTSASLEGAGLALGSARLPLFPRLWALWGDRVGLLAPRVEWRDGPTLGLGASAAWRGGSLTVYALGRADGAELEATAVHHGERLTARARWGGEHPGVSLRGSLGRASGARSVSLRADGASTQAFARSTGALPVERLRGAQELALGATLGDRGGIASGLEFARRGEDHGLRVLAAWWSPVWSRGGLVADVRGSAGAWLDARAVAFSEGEARARYDRLVGPVTVGLFARGGYLEARGTGATPGVELLRGGGTVGVGLRRGLSLTLGAALEHLGSRARAVLEATLEAHLRGRVGAFGARARGLASTDPALPPRVEVRVEHRFRALTLEALLWGDVVLSRVRLTGTWSSARGDRVYLRWTRLALSPWDLAPSWEDPATGPLDLEGVRARRTPVETVSASVQGALGRAWLLRGDVALDARAEALVWAGAGLQWRAPCGCAWVTASAFGVRGTAVVALFTAGLGEAP